MNIQRDIEGVLLALDTAKQLAESVKMQAAVETSVSGGIPFASEFRLPFDTDKAWYEATQRYGPYNYHPDRCEDWNLESGGNTDLGEPLYAPFSGIVLNAHDWGGGIGRVVQLFGLKMTGKMVVWSGWHLHTMCIQHGIYIDVGLRIGSIGNADGRYKGAHLHEQICIVNEWGIPFPTTFAGDGRYDWQQPSAFYVAHGVDADLVERVTVYDGK